MSAVQEPTPAGQVETKETKAPSVDSTTVPDTASEITATTAVTTTAATPVDDKAAAEEAEAGGPRKTPFAEPAPGVVPGSEPPALTTEQQTLYNSLHNAVSEWTLVPGSAAAVAEKPLTDDERMWLTRDCLLRYLRASKWDLATAMQRVASTLLWRRTYGLTSLPDTPAKVTAEYVSPENETGKQWILGFDIEGRPCLYLNPSRQNTKRSDRQIEHLVFMLERLIDLMPPGQETLALLINFAETKSGQGASVGQGKQVLNILQSHYPERLGRALLCNLPWHIWAFMKVITPFIDPVTRKKLVYDSPLQEHVPPAQLCKSHGGTLEFDYDHDVYWPALVQLVEKHRSAMTARWVRGGRLVGEYEAYLKGATERSLKDDVGDSASDQGRGRRLGGSGGSGSSQTRQRSVVLLSSKGSGPDLNAAEQQAAARASGEQRDEKAANGSATALEAHEPVSAQA